MGQKTSCNQNPNVDRPVLISFPFLKGEVKPSQMHRTICPAECVGDEIEYFLDSGHASTVSYTHVRPFSFSHLCPDPR